MNNCDRKPLHRKGFLVIFRLFIVLPRSSVILSEVRNVRRAGACSRSVTSECHPERVSRSDLVELLHSVVSVAKAGYGTEKKREYSPKANESGICDGFSQCLFSL